MKRTLVGILLVLAPAAVALDLPEALSRASARPAAITARLELINTESTLARTAGDPLALRPDLLQAEHAANLATVQLRQAELDALVDIASAYTALLEAREQVSLANAGVELATTGVNIAQIRVANGSATSLDLREAEVSLENALAMLSAAQNGLSIATGNLEGMIGSSVAPVDLDHVAPSLLGGVPPLDEVLLAAARTPELMQVEQGLELATLALEVLDPSYAAPASIEHARTQLDTTEQLVGEARRGFDLQARNLHLQAVNALRMLEVEREVHANASERVSIASERLEAGIIARIEFDSISIEGMTASLELMKAENAYLLALLRLSAGTLVDLPGGLGAVFGAQ